MQTPEINFSVTVNLFQSQHGYYMCGRQKLWHLRTNTPVSYTHLDVYKRQIIVTDLVNSENKVNVTILYIKIHNAAILSLTSLNSHLQIDKY